MARSRGPMIVLWIWLALVVAMGVVGVSLALSASNIKGKVEQIRAATARIDDEVTSFDLEATADTIEEISALWSDVADEASGWQWQVARCVPVFGEDVASLQKATQIADRLSNEAVQPVVSHLQEMGEGFDTDIFSIISNKITQFGELVTVLSDARGVVSECRDEADALPTAHLTQVNEVIETLKEEVGSIDDVLGIFDTLNGQQTDAQTGGSTTTGVDMGEATAA